MSKEIVSAFFIAATCVYSLTSAAIAAPNTPPVKTKNGAEVSKTSAGLVSTTKASGDPVYNAKALHRLDFRVVGKSCAVCLLGIQNKVSKVPGAIKAAVQLQSPYAAVILFDSSKTNQAALLKVAKEGYPEIKFEAVEDKSIDKLPLVLVPKIGNETLTN